MANQPPKQPPQPSFEQQESALLAQVSSQDQARMLADAHRAEHDPMSKRLVNNGLHELVDRGVASVADLEKIAKGSAYGVSILSHHETLTNTVHIDPEKLAKMTGKDYIAAVETFNDGRITKQEQQFLAHLGLDIKAHGVQPLPGPNFPTADIQDTTHMRHNAPAKPVGGKGGHTV